MALFPCLCFDILPGNPLLTVDVFRLISMLPSLSMLYALCPFRPDFKVELIANRYILLIL
jgi:hypothetical protein